MGGHGGLNILPQKRWNVYNFENREKVQKDEEAAAEKERQIVEEQRRRDGEIRREKLLLKAKERKQGLACGDGLPQLEGVNPVPLTDAHPLLHEGRVPADNPSVQPGIQVPAAEKKATNLSVSQVEWADPRDSKEHEPSSVRFSLFEEEERQASHCTATILKPLTAPSSTDRKQGRDAADLKSEEDERYRLGYGASKPWYATSLPGSSSDVCSSRPTLHLAKETCGDSRRKRKHAKGAQDQKQTKEPKKHKKAKDRNKKGEDEDREKARMLQKLREERLVREQRENARAAKLLAQHGQAAALQGLGTAPGFPTTGSGFSSVVGKTRGYNSGYGYGR